MNKLENIGNLYPHNKKVFLKVLENLKIHNKVGVVQATGTGKGKLAACFVEYLLSRKKGAKILIAAPLRSVLENYRDNFNITSDSVKYATYSKINNLSEVDLINIGQQYDLIVLDEYHRCGAPEWFKSIQTLFNGVDKGVCKVIGLTATPIRYLDNSRDMSEELFNGNIIQGLNLEEAILDGILPGFIYNACYFGTEKVLKEVEDKLKNNDYKIYNDTIRNDLMVKVKELNMIYQNRLKIENIIKNNTKEFGRNQKWVIFCRDKQSLGEIREFCVNWFNYKPNLYIINSDRQPEDNDRTLVEFRNAKQGVNVLLCVDMLNEGVHIKDLNGVIMLRKTDSPIIFLQQLGRSLEAGKDFKPIIFDLIGNYKGLKVKEDEIERTPISIVKGIEQKTKGKRNYVIVHNFTEELDKVLDEISLLSQNDGHWEEWEDDIIKKYYKIGGKELCKNKGLMHRSDSAISQRALKLGFVQFSRYTEEERDIIRKYYYELGPMGCIEKGLNRSRKSIVTEAINLGIKYKYTTINWPDEYYDILKKYYEIGGATLCIEKGLNRPERQISSTANRIGLKSPKIWRDEEIEKLKLYYPKGGSELCIEKGILRNKKAISAQAKHLGLKYDKWPKKSLDILLTYFPKGGVNLCQKMGLDKAESSIRLKAKELNLVYEKVSNWEEWEIDIIKQNYEKGGAVLCQKLGVKKTTANITAFANNKLGLKLMTKNWTDEEVSILKKYYPIGGANLCIEKGLNRPYNSIKLKASKLGIKCEEENISGRWDKTDLEKLKRYFPLGGYKLCQQMGLNRSRAGISNKASNLGLKWDKNK